MRVRPGALLGDRRRRQNSLVKNPAPPRSGRPGSITEGRAAEKRIREGKKRPGLAAQGNAADGRSFAWPEQAEGGDEKAK